MKGVVVTPFTNNILSLTKITTNNYQYEVMHCKVNTLRTHSINQVDWSTFLETNSRFILLQILNILFYGKRES